jgi:hypothetical protein
MVTKSALPTFRSIPVATGFSLHSYLMWFEADDCSRVALNSVSSAFNSVLTISIDADNVVEKSPCLQFEAIISAVRYNYVFYLFI